MCLKVICNFVPPINVMVWFTCFSLLSTKSFAISMDAISLIFHPNPNDWHINSPIQLGSCLKAGQHFIFVIIYLLLPINCIILDTVSKILFNFFIANNNNYDSNKKFSNKTLQLKLKKEKKMCFTTRKNIARSPRAPPPHLGGVQVTHTPPPTHLAYLGYPKMRPPALFGHTFRPANSSSKKNNRLILLKKKMWFYYGSVLEILIHCSCYGVKVRGLPERGSDEERERETESTPSSLSLPPPPLLHRVRMYFYGCIFIFFVFFVCFCFKYWSFSNKVFLKIKSLKKKK